MEAIERAANLSVGRACGFCGLAILCAMVGFAFDPALSAKAGSILSLLAALALCFKAWIAPHTNYRRTETWLILPEADRPPSATAQSIISRVLRRTFLVYAAFSTVLSVLLLAASVTLEIVL